MEKQFLTTDKLRQAVLYYAMLGLTGTTLLSALQQQFPLSSLVSILIMPVISVSVCLFSGLSKKILISAVVLQTAVIVLNVFFVLVK